MASNFVEPKVFIDPDDVTGNEKPETPEGPTTPPPSSSLSRRMMEFVGQRARPFLEGTGAVIGGAVAIPPAIASGPAGPLTEAAGIATGAYGGSKLADIVEDVSGVSRQVPEGTKPKNAFLQGFEDVKSSVEQGVAGPIFGKTLQSTGKLVGKVGSQIFGRFGGEGPAAVEMAVESGRKLKGPNIFKSQTEFDKSMREGTSSQQIVESAMDSVNRIRDARTRAYTSELTRLTSPTVTPSPTGGAPIVQPAKMRKFMTMKGINETLDSVLRDAHINIKKDGSLDYSRSALGEEGNLTISKALDKVRSWGAQGPQIQRLKIAVKDLTAKIAAETDPAAKKKMQGMLKTSTEDLKELHKQYAWDRSAIGLDTLKRSLDDFYSPSSKARAFVATLRDKVNRTIVDSVPEYAEMTKGYKEATELINDMEKSFKIGSKYGIGRSGADVALRRMMDVMRKDDTMRKELIGILTEKGSSDLDQKISGKLMSSLLPKSNLVLFGEAGATAWKGLALMLNPEWLALVASSSPRVQGEFLRIIGKTLEETKGGSKVIGQAIATGVYGGKKPMDMTDEELRQALRDAMGFGEKAISKVVGTREAIAGNPTDKKKTFGSNE